MRDAGLVSVIVPAYNQAAYVGQAIDSALSQTYDRVEVIVVNDGSTDETAEVITRYGDRVRQVAQSNAGLSAARNTGIRHSRGEYVAFLDSDDVWLPEKLASQLEVFHQDAEVGLVHAGFLLVDSSLQSVGQPIIPPPDVPSSLWFVLPHNQLFVSTTVVRFSWLDRVGLFEQSLGPTADWNLWIRLATAGCRFGTVAAPLALYRLHGANMSTNAAGMVVDTFATLDRAFQHPILRGNESLKRAAYREQHLLSSIRYESAGDELNALAQLRQAVTLFSTDTDPLDLVARYSHHPVWPVRVTGDLIERRLRRLATAVGDRQLADGAIPPGVLARCEAYSLLMAAKLALSTSPVRSVRLLVHALRIAPAMVADPSLYRRAIRSVISRLGAVKRAYP